MELSIEFGALVKPIKEQLKNVGILIPDVDADRLEEIAHSIVFLHLQDIIPDSVRDKARKKLMARIVSVIRTHGVETK